MVAVAVASTLFYGAIGLVVIVVVVLAMVLLGSVVNSRKKYPSKTAHAKESSALLAPFITSSATHIAHLIRERKITSLEAVRAFSDQMIRVNKHLNAICGTRFEEAEREAREADRRIEECYTLAGNDQARLKELLDALPPFHGVPCSIKECFRLTGMSWSSGLLSRAKNIAEHDATAVKRMRDGGFIPLANTNTSELCMWYESNNPVFGRTNNPYDQSRIVGGSSGGEGAIVAACGSPCGLGSDIGGSIRMPAFFNGVFGHKATGGVVPATGQHPIAVGDALRYLTTGPLTRHACDLWPMLRLMAGPDGFDSACTELSPTLQYDPSKVDITTIEIAHVTNLDSVMPFFVTKLSPEMHQAYDKCVEHLKQRGCKLRPVELKGFTKSMDIWSSMLSAAGGPSFKALLEDSGPQINIAREFLAWSIGRSKFSFPGLLLAAVEQVPKLIPGFNERMVEQGKQLRKYLTEDVIGPDTVLLFPPHPTTAPRHNVPLFRPFNFVYTAIFNTMEVPATQIPLGLDSEGIPLGVQAIARHHHDHLTVAVALELEAAFGGWVPTPFIRTNQSVAK